jgi:ABC-type glycerol-3-phosphate transport system substrate-binding protein
MPFRRALALAALLAAGCGESDRVTVALAVLPSELPPYRAVVAEWERTSGRRVVLVPQGYGDIRRALAAEAAAGTGTIDLVELDVYSLATAASGVRVLDAAALADLTDALDPAAVRAGRRDGLRFLPHRLSWAALVWDASVLDGPPATWEDLLAVARAHPGRIGFKAARYEGLTCDVLPFVWAAGGRGDTLDDAGAHEAFRFFAALAPYLHPESATFKEPTIAEAMARGELVLHVNWPAVMASYVSLGLAPGRIRSAPLPRGPAGRATVLGGAYVAIPKNAPHPDAALALLRHVLGRETQARLARELGWFSPRSDVPVEGGPALAGWVAMRDDVRPRPDGEAYAALSRAWQDAFRDVAFHGVAPDAALAAAAARRGSEKKPLTNSRESASSPHAPRRGVPAQRAGS